MSRWRWHKKTTVEECRSLAIKDLKRLGILRRGVCCGYWPISWVNAEGETVASIGLWAEWEPGGAGRLRLSYSIGRPGEEKESLEYSVRLEATACNYGGERHWFVCPLVTNGRACLRRVGKLYLPPGGKYFGCRHCYSLTYRSVQEHDKRVDALVKLPIEMLLKMSDKGGGLLPLQAAVKKLHKWPL